MGKVFDHRKDVRLERKLDRDKRHAAQRAEAERRAKEAFRAALPDAISAMHGGEPTAHFITYMNVVVFFPKNIVATIWRWADLSTGSYKLLIERVRRPPIRLTRLPYRITDATFGPIQLHAGVPKKMN